MESLHFISRSTSICVLTLIYILVLSGCTYTGRNDLGLYITNFNSVANGDLQIKSEEIVLHTDEETKENTYYLFFPADEGEYMITLNENVDGDIYKCGICIISSIDVDPETVENLFTSELFALKNVSNKTACEIFEELKLDDTSTYTKTNNVTKETDQFTVDLIVNEAGTGIYIS